MRGDKILIRKYHTKAAEKIVKALLPEILSSSRYVITIAGESGAGKTEIAHELTNVLRKKNIRSALVHQDDYFRYPPKTNFRKRREDLSIVGPQEVKFAPLNRHVKLFKDPKTLSIRKPLVYFDENKIEEEILECAKSRVMIVDGTYATLVKNADKRIFIARTYEDTLRKRLARKRDKIDRFDKKILAIEHKVVSGHTELSDIIIQKDFSVVRADGEKNVVRRIAMLTVHGYVDPKPVLGKTDTGGQVTYVLELSKALGKMGIKVDIYTRQFRHGKTVERVSKNVRIIRISCGGKKFIPKEKLLPCLNTFARNMKRFIKKNNLHYDIFHSHYWDAGYAAMKLSERLDYFFVHTFHSLGAWKKEQMGGDPDEMEKLYRFKERIKCEKVIYRKVRALVMTSVDMIKRSRKFYNYRSNNYIVVPAGVNTSIFRPLKKGEKERKIDVPQNYIFWVGRFAANKGLDYLLRAFAETVKKAKDLFLIIGGGSKNPGPEEKKLKKELTRIINVNRIDKRVFFTGHIKDGLIPSYFRKAKFFVLPSKFEPFGMTGAEAMACGSPLVVSKRAGITKYLKNKKNCLSVNPANKKDLSWAFTVLNRNKTFRRKIAKNGLKLARSKFIWRRIAEKSLVFYDALLDDWISRT